MPKVYYNEISGKKAAAIRQLIYEGFLPDGDVDERDIKEVMPNDIKGYKICHFFAGYGGWEFARLHAGWPADRAFWSGSCPCQPFSNLGNKKGKADERHLWPEWERLIIKCKPATIFGEQVSSAIAEGWLDDIYKGLEAHDYAIGAAVLPACAVGSPQPRNRLWFVAHNEGGRRVESDSQQRGQPEGISEESGFLPAHDGKGDVADTDSGRKYRGSGQKRLEEKKGKREMGEQKRQRDRLQPSRTGNAHGDDGITMASTESTECEHGSESWNRFPGAARFDNALGYTSRIGYERFGEHGKNTGKGKNKQPRREAAGTGDADFWGTAIWIICPDGKIRPVEPTIQLLVNGFEQRGGLLHAAGDGIVPQEAAEIIKAFMAI